MGVPRLRILDEKDLDLIDAAARALLERTGADVNSRSAREILVGFGAKPSGTGPRVFFPPALIDEALQTSPREVLLASRDGKHDVRVPDGRPHVTTDGAGVNVWDIGGDQRRPSTRRDLADLTRVADALDPVALQWPMVVAGEVPKELHVLAEVATAFENTTKHIQHEATSGAEAERLVAMASAVVGDPGELRRRPILSTVQCPVSPLILEKGSTEALIVLARAGVPTAPMSMVLMGGSSPVDLASALAMETAEVLASLCVAQAAAPGAPVLWSSSSGPIDMRSGGYASGSPEGALFDAISAEMAHHYHLPSLVGGFGSDAFSPGFQAGAEKLGNGLIAMLSGADLISGIGGLETDNTLSLEQLILDADLVEYAQRAIEPIRVEPDTIHLDMLTRLGPGGNFLKEKHTLVHFRDALWSPRILLREGYVEGETSEKRVRERAQARARELLETHHPIPLEPTVRGAIWEVAGIAPP